MRRRTPLVNCHNRVSKCMPAHSYEKRMENGEWKKAPAKLAG
jgi:hypothetical protein